MSASASVRTSSSPQAPRVVAVDGVPRQRLIDELRPQRHLRDQHLRRRPLRPSGAAQHLAGGAPAPANRGHRAARPLPPCWLSWTPSPSPRTGGSEGRGRGPVSRGAQLSETQSQAAGHRTPYTCSAPLFLQDPDRTGSVLEVQSRPRRTGGAPAAGYHRPAPERTTRARTVGATAWDYGPCSGAAPAAASRAHDVRALRRQGCDYDGHAHGCCWSRTRAGGQ